MAVLLAYWLMWCLGVADPVWPWLRFCRVCGLWVASVEPGVLIVRLWACFGGLVTCCHGSRLCREDLFWRLVVICTTIGIPGKLPVVMRRLVAGTTIWVVVRLCSYLALIAWIVTFGHCVSTRLGGR